MLRLIWVVFFMGCITSEELDDDGDGVGNYEDNCIMVKNADQKDLNQNQVGDVCDLEWEKYLFDRCWNVDVCCGDGILHDGEQCDDGNNIDGDKCTNSCQPYMMGISSAGTPAGTQGGTPAGTPAGTPIGMEAGIPAGTPAGTPAGMEAGTPVGTPAGMQMSNSGVLAINGSWVSEGADVAELLSGLGIVRLTSQFNTDLSFSATAQNSSNDIFNLAGTYTVSGSGPIYEIELIQTTPQQAQSKGIFKVEGNVLTYEVAQTVPLSANVTPPTVSGGFGSTSDGAYGNQNVQTYRRLP